MPVRISDPIKGFQGLYGRPKFRSSVVVASAGTPKDTLNTGGTQYTFKGGELLMLQGNAPFYVEVTTAGSMTASGGKAWYVDANQPWYVWLFERDTTVAIDGVSSAVTVKVFEMDGV